MTEIAYVGSELELFARAKRWKSYVKTKVTPYLGRSVLEVGAGFGGTTRLLATGSHESWLCLEPDPELGGQLAARVSDGELPDFISVRVDTTENLSPDESFDTILYMDVLEHIEDDQAEFARAASHLADGGYLVILCPAHNYLYAPFDKAIGHFRRYDAKMYRQLTAESLRLRKLWYMDSVGLLASMTNKVLLKQSMPTARQIQLWDSVMVPSSRWIDPLLRHAVGKSILGIWQKI